MLAYRCPVCGRIYDKKDVSQSELCPSCGVYLKIVNIKKEGEIQQGNEQPVSGKVGRTAAVGRVQKEVNEKSYVPSKCDEISNETEIKEVAICNFEKEEQYDIKISQYENISGNRIEGTVVNATNDLGYHRFPWEKLYDKYFYSQKVSDSQNSIYVRCVNGDGSISNKTIVMYGQIKGGIGIVRTGMRIKGEGKINRQNEFVAKNLIIEDSINVRTRTEIQDILYFISPLLLMLLVFFFFNFVKIIQSIVTSTYLKWILISIAGIFALVYSVIGKVWRAPVINRIRTSIWISIILAVIVFFWLRGFLGYKGAF